MIQSRPRAATSDHVPDYVLGDPPAPNPSNFADCSEDPSVGDTCG
jgi:hypothetical protein